MKEDPSTREEEIVRMHPESRLPIREVSDKAWGAVCDLVGGEDRIDPRDYKVEGHFGQFSSLN